MTITSGFKSISDLHGKLKRDKSLLGEEVTLDHLYNFFLTGYSVVDWVKNDPSVPKSAKEKSIIDSIYKNQWITICGEIANANKHFQLTKPNPTTKSVTSHQGWGTGRFGQGQWGIGEVGLTIELNDGKKYNCFEIVNGVVDFWDAFFLTHQIK